MFDLIGARKLLWLPTLWLGFLLAGLPSQAIAATEWNVSEVEVSSVVDDESHGGDAHGEDHGDDPGAVFSKLYSHVPAHQLGPGHPLDVFGFYLMTFDTKVTLFGLPLYNIQFYQVLAVLLIFVLFAGVAGQVRRGTKPSVMAAFLCWIRDEMIYPIMGREEGDRYAPLFASLFFFILFQNLLGLVPGGLTATACIFVTGSLALVTLFAMLFLGMWHQGPVTYWKNLLPHGLPKAIIPLMFVVEFVGLLVKPFALTVRLFANMTAGHLVVLSFMGLIFFFGQSMGSAVGYASSPMWIGFAVFIMIIEGFVALLQAYIFTLLSIIFVGGSIHPEH